MIETFGKGTRVKHRDYAWEGTVDDEDTTRIWVDRDDGGSQWYDKLMFIRVEDRTDASQSVDEGLGVADLP